MRSFQHLLDLPVPLQDGAELFCLDLYKRFDIDGLMEMSGASRFHISE